MLFILKKLIRQYVNQLPPRAQCYLIALRSRRIQRLGRRSYLHHTVQLTGKSNILIGDNTVVSQDSWLNVNIRKKNTIAIEIGNNCFIGRRNFFTSGLLIKVGDFVLTANDCYFLGSSHIISNPLKPCITTGTTDNDTIVIGHNTFVGAGAKVLGNVRIGHGCVIGASTLVTKDILPFSLVAGSPARIIKRYSFRVGQWVNLDLFDPNDELLMPNEIDYLVSLNLHKPPDMPYLAAGSDMGNC